MSDDKILLLPDQKSQKPWYKRTRCICPILVTIGILLIATIIAVYMYKNSYHDPIDLKIMSLNCWGVPATFGSYDKEARMSEIGAKIALKEYDIYLLEELWMRPDHQTIKDLVSGTGYYVTEVHELAVYGECDGRATPTYCSGLAIVSRFPFNETEFSVFSVHGDAFWNDGEYFARKGVGRVRILPVPHITVDVFVTHTAASDYNHYYREIQTREVVEHVKASTADFAILGGDFNIDPRMTNETTYDTLTSELSSAMQEFFYYVQELLAPKRATYGNPENTYSADFGPQLYDYIFHRSKGWNAVVINFFDVPFLKGLIKSTFSAEKSANASKLVTGSETSAAETAAAGVGATAAKKLVSLSDHEAISTHLILFKYKGH